MSDMDIKSFVSFLLVAGSESTDYQMSNMWLRLLENPDQLAAVREDRSLIGSAFAESLRHTPAVLMIMRQAGEDAEFHGTTVSAGSTVTLMLAAANRDPRKFADPERFDLFRRRARRRERAHRRGLTYDVRAGTPLLHRYSVGRARGRDRSEPFVGRDGRHRVRRRRPSQAGGQLRAGPANLPIDLHADQLAVGGRVKLLELSRKSVPSIEPRAHR